MLSRITRKRIAEFLASLLIFTGFTGFTASSMALPLPQPTGQMTEQERVDTYIAEKNLYLYQRDRLPATPEFKPVATREMTDGRGATEQIGSGGKGKDKEKEETTPN